MESKTFTINQFITLKFEDNQTIIYFNGEEFLQCKYLLLNIPIDDSSNFDEIRSVDEAAEALNSSMEPNGSVGKPYKIPPEVEFWGHCSNLQVWAEYEYDSRLIHRSLAFPLLKKLVDAGDPLAKKVFKKEIAKRFTEGNEKVRNYLINEDYMDYLERDELWSTLPQECEILSEIEKEVKIKFQLGTDCWGQQKKEGSEIIFSLEDNKTVQRVLFFRCNFKYELWDWILNKLEKLKTLKVLAIEYSNLERVPDTIGKLISLKSLNLSHNNLNELTTSIGKLNLLENLILNYNSLNNLPSIIENLFKLKILYLRFNKFTIIPEVVKNLKSLETLDLSYNEVDQKSKLLSSLENIRHLYITKKK